MPDGNLCITGVFTNTVETFNFDNYCVPDTSNISSFFDSNALKAWASDLSRAWYVLVVAAFAAVLLSLLFLVFVRCCAGVMIWMMIIVAILGS